MKKCKVVIEGERQSGKTTRLAETIYDRMIRGDKCFLFSPLQAGVNNARDMVKNLAPEGTIGRDTRNYLEFRNGGLLRFYSGGDKDQIDFHLRGLDAANYSLFMNDCEYFKEIYDKLLNTPHFQWKETIETRCAGPDAAKNV